MDQVEPSPARTPESVLDALRARATALSGVAQRTLCDEVVEQFEPADLIRAARARMHDLSGGDAPAILRIVELFGTRDDFDALARTALNQPGLRGERAWAVLAILQDAGVLAQHPDLADRWNEMEEELDETDRIAELAAQLEDAPEEGWVLLHALGGVEPDVVVSIVEGLAEHAESAGVAAFLEALAFSLDGDVSRAALDALAAAEPSAGTHAWHCLGEIAVHHFDARVRNFALDVMGEPAKADGLPLVLAKPGNARAVEACVGPVDGQGVGRLAILTEGEGGGWVAAGFVCEMDGGVREAQGLDGAVEEDARTFVDEFFGIAERARIDRARGAECTAEFLRLSLEGARPSQAPLSLAYWVKRTIGLGFYRALAERSNWAEESKPETPLEFDAALAARVVLEACEDWHDDSTLCRELAREAVARGRDLEHDEATLRLLLERGISGDLGRLRGMLWWMARYWAHRGTGGRAAAALGLAIELEGVQEQARWHPFLLEYARRSLRDAAEEVGGGAVEVES